MRRESRLENFGETKTLMSMEASLGGSQFKKQTRARVKRTGVPDHHGKSNLVWIRRLGSAILDVGVRVFGLVRVGIRKPPRTEPILRAFQSLQRMHSLLSVTMCTSCRKCLATVGERFPSQSFHSPQSKSPRAVRKTPTPCCFPSRHSPSYFRPSGQMKIPFPSFLSPT